MRNKAKVLGLLHTIKLAAHAAFSKLPFFLRWIISGPYNDLVNTINDVEEIIRREPDEGN